MRSTLIFCLIIAAVALHPTSAFAIKPVRCNGRIQFYPCAINSTDTENTASSLTSSLQHNAQVARIPTRYGVPNIARYARIVKQTYIRLSRGDGKWHGTVKGNGLVHLKLQIWRNGEIESTRDIGSVPLADKETWFSFVSVNPSGHDWTWKLVAFAT